MAWDLSGQLLPATTLVASGTGPWIDPEGVTGTRSGVILAQMIMASVTGTNPTLDMYVEESDDQTNIYEAGKFDCGVPVTALTLITATSTLATQYQCVCTRKRRYLRVRWVVGGTGALGFNVTAIYSRALGIQIPDVPAAG